jgi:hypothetical protein
MDLGLFHLMEDFILNEVDSQEIQNSSRAKRRMRRNLNKELAPYLNDETHSEDDSIDEEYENEYESPHKKYKYDYSEPIYLYQRHVDICLGIAYICVLFTFYGTTIYLIQNYSKCI